MYFSLISWINDCEISDLIALDETYGKISVSFSNSNHRFISAREHFHYLTFYIFDLHGHLSFTPTTFLNSIQSSALMQLFKDLSEVFLFPCEFDNAQRATECVQIEFVRWITTAFSHKKNQNIVLYTLNAKENKVCF